MAVYNLAQVLAAWEGLVGQLGLSGGVGSVGLKNVVGGPIKKAPGKGGFFRRHTRRDVRRHPGNARYAGGEYIALDLISVFQSRFSRASLGEGVFPHTLSNQIRSYYIRFFTYVTLGNSSYSKF